MKKDSFFGLALMAAATMMIGCEPKAEVNPTFDGETVKTQFAINVPAGVKPGTRMANDVVQNNYQFNGIKNIYLASLTEDPVANSAYTSVYRLPVINSNNTQNTNGIQKVYENVTIPVGTTHFMFWGESAAEGTKSHTGVLNNNLSLNSTMSNSAVTFNLEKIDPAGLVFTQGHTLVQALNRVIWAYNANNKTWWDLATVDVANQTAGEKQILKLKDKLCLESTASAYYRWLGSYSAVEDILSDLKAALSAIADEDLNDDIATGSMFDSKGLRDAMVSNINTELTNIAASVDHNFPENLGLPQGAAIVEFKSVPTGGGNFEMVNISTSTVISGGAYLDASSLCYPASLNYIVTTPLKANNAKQEAWPQGVSAWTTQAWTGWGNVVAATTQAIALVNNINYSVARMDVNVKVASVASLDDNAVLLEGAAQPSHIPSNMFKVTGIAIGGQPVACDWQVLPKAGDAYSNTVWDKEISNTNYITESAQEFCKTLVLDNKFAGTPQKNVVVAVEIQNGSGTDFCGYNGIIKAGAKFYMLASLDPTTGTKPTGISAEEEAKLDHVFVQDHNTKVVFTMKDLKNAYIGVPDLRSTDLQLGLSVDLEWLQGLTFNVDFN